MIDTGFHDTFTKPEVRANVAKAALLKREGSLLAEALDSRCASTLARAGHADICSHAGCWRRAGRRWNRRP